MKENGAESTRLASMLWQYFNDRQWDAAKELLSDDFEAVWPQSREKIIGPKNFIELNRTYPGNHKIQVLNTHYFHDRWERIDTVVTEVLIQSRTPEGKDHSLFAVSIFEIEDDKIRGVTEYWADTYLPPKWRKDLVETY